MSSTNAIPCRPAESRFGLEYYKKYYPDYEAQNPPEKLRFYRQVIERYLEEGTPRRIHDLGCAFGGFLASLDDAWEIHGSDVSEEAVRAARRKVPRGLFAVAAATSLPDGAGAYGVITAFDVLEHVVDLDRLGESIQERIVAGGLFVFVVPVYDGLSGPVIHLLDRDPTHVHRWPRRRWLEWAESRFDVLEWWGILRYLWPWKRYLHRPTQRFRRHTPAILVACRKR